MKWPSWFDRNRFSTIVIACLIGIVIPLVQYYFRRFDDNPFTGWYLIFLTTPRSNVLLLFSSVILAFAFFRIPFSLSRPLFLFLACFVATVFFWSVPEINTVSARYVTQAKNLEIYGISYFLKEWGHGIQAWMDLPAVPFFDGIIFKAFGESRVCIQLFTAFLFGMTAVVTYFIGKSLWDEETGFYGGILLLGIPYLIIQTPLMLLDIHTMFFLTLSIYLYIRALETGGLTAVIVATGALFIAFFCKYSVWPMLSVLPVISLVYYFRRENRGRREILRTSLCVFLLSLLLVGIPILLKFDVLVYQIKLMFSFLRPSLGRWTENFSSIYLFQIDPVITVAAVVSVILAAWKRDLKYLVVFWLPFLAVFFKIKRIRYILPVFPMLTLMAAQGLVSLRNRDLEKIIVAAVVATSLATCFLLYRPFLKQWSAVNLEEAGRFLDTLDVDVVDVIAVPQQHYPVNPAIAVPLLDLSTHKRIFYHYVPDASTAEEDYHTSRFRDSWEYQNPPYYEMGAELPSKKRAVAVILAKVEEKIPPDVKDTIEAFPHTKSFTTYSPFLGNHTIVRIYW
jgi:4-amino-4-deoxy-L-arabinose transferase-like glycosyltransferase